MFSGRVNFPDFGHQNSVEQFIAFGVFWLVTIGAGIALNALFPGVNLVLLIVLSGLAGTVGSFAAARAMGRAHDRRRKDAETEYRDMMKAQKTQQIDAMLRNNSKIPKVKR